MLKIDTEDKKNVLSFSGSTIEISAELLSAIQCMFEQMHEQYPDGAEKFGEIIKEHIHRCFLTGKEKEEFEKECKDAKEKIEKLVELDDLLDKILKLVEED